MAKPGDELNLGKNSASKSKGGMKKIIIIVVALLVVVGATVAAFFLMGSGEATDATTEAAVSVTEKERAPIYHELVKDFVVTFDDEGRLRYLQVSLQVMSYRQDVIDRIDTYMPAVRNSLILLIGGQHYDDLKTNEGKEKLRAEIISSIKQVARLKPDQKVEDVLYTSFVLQ